MSGEREVLEPELTAFDRRVLAALDQWTRGRDLRDEPLDWRNAWQVGEAVREDDVAMVRRTLDGLGRFRYATDNGWDQRRSFVAVAWRREPALPPARPDPPPPVPARDQPDR